MASISKLPQSPFSAKRPNPPPPRQPNQARRTREHLTSDEDERLIVAARQADGRLAERDALLIMTAFRRGATEFHLEELRADGLPIPQPTTRCEYIEAS